MFYRIDITALFNNMRTLKFNAQPTNAFFAAVNQVFGCSSQPPTTGERCSYHETFYSQQPVQAYSHRIKIFSCDYCNSDLFSQFHNPQNETPPVRILIARMHEIMPQARGNLTGFPEPCPSPNSHLILKFFPSFLFITSLWKQIRTRKKL